MTTGSRRLLVCVALCAAAVPAAAAPAAGPPLPSSATGKTGVVAPGGHERLITRRSGGDTLVEAVRRGEGTVLRSRVIEGLWRVAPAAFDGATTGLSADGRVLVLPRPEQAFPPSETRLAVVDARELTLRRTITLPGFFTLDAVSSDGHWAYLIQYAGQNVLDYRVRALDTTTGKLAARDVVDPREPDEQMGGLPMTRVVGRDGRWVYTLYSGGEETFIHALDTAGRTAACIDLPMLPPVADVSLIEMRLSQDGGRLRVRNAGTLAAIVDTRTFAVRAPGEPAATEPVKTETKHAAAPPRPADARDGGGFPWLVLVVLPALAGGALFLRAQRPASFQK